MNYRTARSSAPQPFQRVGWFRCSQASFPLLQNSSADLNSADRYVFQPGGGRELRYVQAETFLYVLSGQLSVRIAEEQTILSAGDAIHILAGCTVGLFNDSTQDCTMLAIHCKP